MLTIRSIHTYKNLFTLYAKIYRENNLVARTAPKSLGINAKFGSRAVIWTALAYIV